MKYMMIQVQCDGMTGPADALQTDITEAKWKTMSDEEQHEVIVDGAWNIIDAWAEAREI